MRKRLMFLFRLLFVASVSFGQYTMTNYESVTLDFPSTWGGTSFSSLTNPDQSGINVSATCAKTTTTDQEWGWAGIATNGLGGTFNFTTDSVFKMKVYAPISALIVFKLESSSGAASAIEVKLTTDAADNNTWKELSFDFANAEGGAKPVTGVYDKIALIFDGGGYNFNDWYFDDIIAPGFTPTPAKSTFYLTDYEGIVPEQVKVYDNLNATTTYSLYNDGTNGDAAADDNTWTAVANDLTGAIYSSAAGTGEYEWEALANGSPIAAKQAFTQLGEMTHYYVIQYAYKTSIAPTIDGTIDAMWANASKIDLSKKVSGTVDNAADLSASVKIAFDATNIYFLAEITDETLNNAHANDWEKDCFEIYFDINDDASYSGGVDGQNRWIWNNTNSGAPGTSAQADVTGGWVLEISIPLADLATGFTLEDGLPIGIDFNANDNDGGNREGILSWHINTDGAYNTPSGLGDVTLTNAYITITDDGSTTEGAENGETITVSLQNDTFVASLTAANWKIPNLPAGVSIGSIARTNATTATITLNGNATTDYDLDIDLLVMVDPAELTLGNQHVQANSGATLTATVELGTDNTLQTLTVSSGALNPAFDPQKTDYVVELDTSVSTVPTITAVVNETGAIKTESLTSSLPGTSTITVEAYNTGEKKTYTVKFVYSNPHEAAPNPPNRLASEVISIFSDAYKSLKSTDFRAWWSSGDYTADTIANNPTIKYTTCNYVGIYPASGIDASSMEFLHIDVWTGNASSINLQLVDAINIDLPVTPYQWVSYNIPYADFASKADNLYLFKFEAQGGTIFIDNMYFYRTIPSGKNPYLSDIKVDGTSIADFLPNTFNYNYLTNSTSVPALSAINEDANAGNVITNASSLPGTSTIVSTSQDASVSKTYKVNLVNLLNPISRNADSVISILSDSYNDEPGSNFNPGWGQATKWSMEKLGEDSVMCYANLNFQGTDIGTNPLDVSGMDSLHIDLLAYGGSTVKIYCISNSTGDGPGVELTLSEGKWKGYDIPLSSFTNNGANSISDLKQFKIEGAGSPTLFVDNFYFYIGNSDASLNDIVIDGLTVDGFDAETLSYNVVLPHNTSTTPTVSANSLPNSSIEITSPATVPCVTTIKVTAEDGTTIQNYTINFTVAPDTDATLSDIMIDGTSISTFDATTLTYNIEVPYGSSVPKVLATTTDVNADTAITAATSIPGATTILVTAEDGTTTQTYTVNFTEVAPVTISSLSDLMVDDVTVSGFKVDSIEYEYEVPFGTNVFPKVSYVLSDPTASAKIVAATVESKTDTVIVTAQDGSTTKYTVKFVYAAASADATLAELTLDDTPISGFKADSMNYEVELPFGSTEVPEVNAISTHDSALVVITQAATLNDTAVVVVTAQDGTTIKTYEVSFTVSAFISTDATLQAIKVNGIAIANFSANKFLYTVELPFDIDAVPAITGVKTNLAAKVAIDTAKTLSDTTIIKVTAQDDSTILIYKVAFTLSDPVYDVTFVVSNGTKGLLKGAQVTFLLDTLTTDINGSVVFTQVSVTTDAAYSVTLEGYEDVSGTLSVVDADVTKEIVMTLKSYDVKFEVINTDSTAIALADVIFNGDTVQTDSSGIALFKSVLPNSIKSEAYVYTVSKEGYFTASDSISVIDTAVNVNVVLEKESYDVTFTVVDNSNMVIKEAQVVFMGDTILTDTLGVAIFAKVAPVTDTTYSVSKEGFVTATGKVSVVDSAINVNIILSPVSYTVTFTVVDETSAVVEGAQIAIAETTALTNAEGLAEIQLTPVTDAAYTVSKDGYTDAVGTVTVIDTAVVVNVVLESIPEPTYSAVFTVVDAENNAVEGAEIVLLETTVLTDAEGKATFIELSPVNDAPYTISKDGFEVESGTISIIDTDVEVEVVLTAVDINDNLNLISHVYPNPTSGIINIELSNAFTNATVKVFNSQGALVAHTQLFEMHSIIDLSMNNAGIYLVNVEIDKRMYYGRIVINK